ncbi:MAG: hypothetical protein FJ098_13980, partial [Deltaproteobacteria bacterium]|nr:hypothetical protein [Deltaproteobacteria bacterium]
MGGERRYGLRVAVLWALFFIMTAGTELGSGLTEAMLLARLGASNLGAAFILEALLRLGSTAGYLWFADRVRAGALFRGISWVNLAAGLALAGALAADLPGSVLLFYGAVRVLENILVLHWGVYLVDFFSVRETTRAFPVIYSAGRVASFAAGAALSGIAGASSAAWGVGLYLVSGAALLGLVSLIPEAAGAPGGNGGGSGRRRGTLQGLAEGWRYTVRTPLVRAMILASVAMVLMRRLLDSALGVRMEELFA